MDEDLMIPAKLFDWMDRNNLSWVFKDDENWKDMLEQCYAEYLFEEIRND